MEPAIHATTPPPTNTRRGFVVAGAVTLGVGYLLSSMVSGVLLGVGEAQRAADGMTCMDGVGWGFLPVIGPALAASSYANEVRVLHEQRGSRAPGYSIDCTSGATPMAVFGTVMTAIQGGGAAMLALGLVLPKPVTAAQVPARPSLPRFAAILPGAPGASLGLHVTFAGF